MRYAQVRPGPSRISEYHIDRNNAGCAKICAIYKFVISNVEIINIVGLTGIEKHTMGDQGLSAAQFTDDGSIMTFREAVRRLWMGRMLLVLLPVIAVSVAFIATTAGSLRDRQIFSYHVKLIGVENGTYPNGTAFTPGDLKSTAILDTLADRFDLTADMLETAISINYDNPAAAGIALKYQTKLSARGLQPADIDGINNAYLEELSASMASGLRISVNNKYLTLSSSDLKALAFAIPATWNDIFLKRYRVLASSKLTGMAVTSIPEHLNGTARLLVVGAQLDRIADGLRLISEDNRLSGLATSDAQTADDLRNLLRAFRTVYYDPLIGRGFSASDSIATSAKEQLRLRVQDINRQIEGLDQNLARLPGEGSAQPASLGSTSASSMEQGALETVIALVHRASYTTYIKDVLDKRQDLVEEMSRVQARLDSIVLRIDGTGLPPSTELSESAEKSLDLLTSKYRNLYSTAQTRLLTSSGRFYTALSTPSELPEQTILSMAYLLLASAVGGLSLAVILALLAPSIRSAVGKRPAHVPTAIRMVAAGAHPLNK